MRLLCFNRVALRHRSPPCVDGSSFGPGPGDAFTSPRHPHARREESIVSGPPDHTPRSTATGGSHHGCLGGCITRVTTVPGIALQCTGSRTSRFSDRFAIGHFRCVRLDGNLACPARRPTKQRGLGSFDVPRSGVRFGNRSAQPHHAHGSGAARPVGTAGLRPACSAQADCTGAPTPGCRACRTERAASVSPSDGIPQDLPARRGGATDTGRPCRRATIPNGSGPAGQAIAPVPAAGNRADSTPIPRRRGCRVSVPSGSSSA